ncbi:MAG: hypothetical protein Q7J15_04620 [Candidatus Desulfaltia sp.]|nr:hypothetical protein [Candidatus Desulfaltia sp.]
MKKGKTLVFVSFILLSLFLMSLTPIVSFARAITIDSECINCHTNLKKLIRLCWEIEKTRSKAGNSAETSGEG